MKKFLSAAPTIEVRGTAIVMLSVTWNEDELQRQNSYVPVNWVINIHSCTLYTCNKLYFILHQGNWTKIYLHSNYKSELVLYVTEVKVKIIYSYITMKPILN